MAEFVGAFGTPHMPNAPGQVLREGPGSETGQLFEAVHQQLEAVDPDVLVVFDTDHFHTFFWNNMPTFSVGVAERTHGPAQDDWPGLPSYEVEVDEPLGQHLHEVGLRESFDLAVTLEFTIDHSIIVPLHFLSPEMRRPMVPVWINGIAPPFPLARRCYALGEMVRRAIEAWPSQTRVAAVASGTISGDIGGPRARDHSPGAPADEAWVQQVVDRLARGEVNELLDEVTTERLLQAGNVSGEMLNWIALLGAVGGRKPRLIEPQLDGGNAYAAWRWD